MPKRLLVFISLLTCSLISIFARAQASSSPIKWQPVIENSRIDANEVFPAEILALATRHVPQDKLARNYMGDPNSVFGVLLVSAIPNAQVTVTIRVDGLSDESTFDATIPEPNQQYEIWPTIRFNTRSLVRMRESFPTTAVFSVSLNGKLAGTQSRSVQVRSVNDLPYEYHTRDGQVLDYSVLFAAFVDENNPLIDGILHEALEAKAVEHFAGYQVPPKEVFHQVFAIWNVLQRRGVKYSSITTPSAQSQIVFSQHVRFLDEAVQNSEANCVDGTVLFASVLYKLGIYPLLVKVPGHMFLGFYTDSERKGKAFLETTLIGEPGIGHLRAAWNFLTPDGYLVSESYKQFLRATEAGADEFQKAYPNFQAKAPGYRLIAEDGARRLGIAAIPRP